MTETGCVVLMLFYSSLPGTIYLIWSPEGIEVKKRFRLSAVLMVGALLLLSCTSSEKGFAGVGISSGCHTFEKSSESSYCSFFGGSSQEDATKVAYDLDGNTILIGQTGSNDLPVTDGALQRYFRGGEWDPFVAKFDVSGGLLWATYLGGFGYDHLTSVNVDLENNILLAGTTSSPNFPITEDAYQSTFRGEKDGFVTKLSPNGTLLYSTYLGGTGEDWIYGMELDSTGNMMFSGWTTSAGLATYGAYREDISGADAFVARLSADGSRLEMFSYIGGSGTDRAWSMTVDGQYDYVISGVTESSDLDVSEKAFQMSYGGGTDAYLAVVAHNGSKLLYMTYVGGSGEDMGLGIDVDSDGNYILAGPTTSRNLNLHAALQPLYGGGASDSFVAEFNTTGGVKFMTYIGGSRTDRIWDARVTPQNTIVLVGRTNSNNYPTSNASYLELAGDYDAFATEVSVDGQRILRSGLIGGTNEDIGEGIAIDSGGSIVITGRTLSSNLPVSENAFQKTRAGSTDVFVCHTIFEVFRSNTTNTSVDEINEIDLAPVLVVCSAVAALAIALVIFTTKRR
jgi:hypothetical protein